MIALTETGTGFALESKQKGGARRGCGCIVLGFALLTLVMLAMAIVPPMQVTFDCSRQRGNCTDHARVTPLSDISKARLYRDQRGSSRGWRVSTVSFQLELANKKPIYVCTSPADDPDAAELAKDVAGANAFFTSPAAQSYRVTCSDGKSTLGERIYYPSSTGFLLVVGVLVWRNLRGQRVMVDTKARVVRMRGPKGPGVSKQDIPFADIEAVELEGSVLRLLCRSGRAVALAAARDASEQETLMIAKSRVESALSSA